MCLIVAGVNTVDVVDTERDVVWSFPKVTGASYMRSIVAISSGVALIGVDRRGTCETLSLVEANEELTVRI